MKMFFLNAIWWKHPIFGAKWGLHRHSGATRWSSYLGLQTDCCFLGPKRKHLPQLTKQYLHRKHTISSPNKKIHLPQSCSRMSETLKSTGSWAGSSQPCLEPIPAWQDKSQFSNTKVWMGTSNSTQKPLTPFTSRMLQCCVLSWTSVPSPLMATC